MHPTAGLHPQLLQGAHGDDAKASHPVSVSALPPHTSDRDLTHAMSRFGVVRRVAVARDKRRREDRSEAAPRCKGTALVFFATIEGAQAAKACGTIPFEGRQVRVTAVKKDRTDGAASEVLCAFGLPLSTTEQELSEALRDRSGAITHVSIVKDRVTGKSKGFGFIYFTSAEAARVFMETGNSPCVRVRGQLIRFDYSLTREPRETDARQVKPSDASLAASRSRPCNVLGCFGLHRNATEQDLDALFSPYGLIRKIDIVIDKTTGSGKGYGFVYFARTEDATSAYEAIQRGDLSASIHGQQMRVDYSLTTAPPRTRAWGDDGETAGAALSASGSGSPSLTLTSPPTYVPTPSSRQIRGGSGSGGLATDPTTPGASSSSAAKPTRPCNVLGCFGLPKTATEAEVLALFAPFGHVLKTDIVMDKTTGRCKGYGFVYFNTTQDATRALQAMQTRERCPQVQGQPIRVDYSLTTAPPQTRGGAGGQVDTTVYAPSGMAAWATADAGGAVNSVTGTGPAALIDDVWSPLPAGAAGKAVVAPTLTLPVENLPDDLVMMLPACPATPSSAAGIVSSSASALLPQPGYVEGFEACRTSMLAMLEALMKSGSLTWHPAPAPCAPAEDPCLQAPPPRCPPGSGSSAGRVDSLTASTPSAASAIPASLFTAAGSRSSTGYDILASILRTSAPATPLPPHAPVGLTSPAAAAGHPPRGELAGIAATAPLTPQHRKAMPDPSVCALLQRAAAAGTPPAPVDRPGLRNAQMLQYAAASAGLGMSPSMLQMMLLPNGGV